MNRIVKLALHILMILLITTQVHTSVKNMEVSGRMLHKKDKDKDDDDKHNILKQSRQANNTSPSWTLSNYERLSYDRDP